MSHDDIDWDKVEDAALALMYLTLHGGNRVWKHISWEITDRLFEHGLISDPKSKARSVALTEEGMARAERLFREMFVKGAEAGT